MRAISRENRKHYLSNVLKQPARPSLHYLMGGRTPEWSESWCPCRGWWGWRCRRESSSSWWCWRWYPGRARRSRCRTWHSSWPGPPVCPTPLTCRIQSGRYQRPPWGCSRRLCRWRQRGSVSPPRAGGQPGKYFHIKISWLWPLSARISLWSKLTGNLKCKSIEFDFYKVFWVFLTLLKSHYTYFVSISPIHHT